MDEHIPVNTSKPPTGQEKPSSAKTLRINLKCPRERELLEKYYNERRVLDNSVPKEVITAFKVKEEQKKVKTEYQKERYKRIVETDPVRLEKIREQSRNSKRTYRQKQKAEKESDNQSTRSGYSTAISDKLFPSSSECRSEEDSQLSDEDLTECESEVERAPPAPPPRRGGGFFLGGMRF